MQPGLRSTRRYAKAIADGLDRQVSPVPQDERDPLVGRQGRQRAQDRVASQQARERICGGGRDGLIDLGPSNARTAPAQSVPTHVHEDSIEPRLGAAELTERASLSPGPEQGVLGGVFSFASVAKDEAGEPVGAVQFVAADCSEPRCARGLPDVVGQLPEPPLPVDRTRDALIVSVQTSRRLETFMPDGRPTPSRRVSCTFRPASPRGAVPALAAGQGRGTRLRPFARYHASDRA